MIVDTLPDHQLIHHFSDGLYAKEIRVQAGQAILKHTHRMKKTRRTWTTC